MIALDRAAQGLRILAKLGLCDADCSVSVRTGDSGPFTLEGSPAERAMHEAIYAARPEVNAIVHTHQPVATLFADVRRPIVALGGTGGNVCYADAATYDCALAVGTPARAADVARLLGAAPYVFLRNHGITFAAERIEDAVVNAIWLEDHARATLAAASIGAPRGLGPEEAAIKAAQRFGIEGRWNYYAGLLD